MPSVDANDALFLLLVGLTALVAGAIGSVSGFGIGSLLTPLLALRVSTKLAVAVVAVPHLLATLLRCWIMRRHIDRRLLRSFGIMSAAGGLAGALLHASVDSPLLTALFGALLVFTGLLGLTGLSQRLRFRGWVGWAAGIVSGILGGMVGNQGGIRSAAMLGFDVPRHAFVATATAVGVLVDAARMPVYLAHEAQNMAPLWPVMVSGSVGALLGTLAGERLLRRVPESLYRQVVAGLLVALGSFMLVKAWVW